MDLSEINKIPTKYKSWDENNLLLATQYVKDGHSLREAAEVFRVPKSTLYDTMKNPSDPAKKGGNHIFLQTMKKIFADMSNTWLTQGRLYRQNGCEVLRDVYQTKGRFLISCTLPYHLARTLHVLLTSL